MITSVDLKNYKSFYDEHSIELKPITVLCGRNSSGKSSILKSLMLLKQGCENSSNYGEMLLNGKYIKCGFFRDIISRNKSDMFAVSCKFCIESPLRQNENKLIRKTANVTRYKDLNSIFSTKGINADRYYVKFLVEFGSCKRNILPNSAQILKYKIEISDGNKNYEISITRCVAGDYGDKDFSKWEISTRNFPVLGKAENLHLKDCSVYYNSMQITSIYVAQDKDNNLSSDKLQDLLPKIYTLSKVAVGLYSTVRYLGPSRLQPLRHYTADMDSFDGDISGSYTPISFVKKMNNKLSLYLPDDSNSVAKRKEKINLNGAIKRWLKYLGGGDFEAGYDDDIVNLSVDKSNIIDVGYGISQVFPILLSGLLLKQEECLVVEQPEIHLHPSMQMQLVDFFIATMRDRKQIILETHSDHIINRIIRRVMEDESKALLENVSIYYVTRDSASGKSTVEDIELDMVNGIKKAPRDFFSQYASEVDAIITKGFANMRQDI
ncbi:AAA family ATPase [Anaerovibrio slackiae]|nr:AAA family ATPase [Anaerovibrio slackiae]